MVIMDSEFILGLFCAFLFFLGCFIVFYDSVEGDFKGCLFSVSLILLFYILFMWGLDFYRVLSGAV